MVLTLEAVSYRIILDSVTVNYLAFEIANAGSTHGKACCRSRAQKAIDSKCQHPRPPHTENPGREARKQSTEPSAMSRGI